MQQQNLHASSRPRMSEPPDRYACCSRNGVLGRWHGCASAGRPFPISRNQFTKLIASQRSPTIAAFIERKHGTPPLGIKPDAVHPTTSSGQTHAPTASKANVGRPRPRSLACGTSLGHPNATLEVRIGGDASSPQRPRHHGCVPTERWGIGTWKNRGRRR